MMTVTLDDHFDNMFDDQIYQNYHTRCIGAPMHPRCIGAAAATPLSLTVTIIVDQNSHQNKIIIHCAKLLQCTCFCCHTLDHHFDDQNYDDGLLG